MSQFDPNSAGAAVARFGEGTAAQAASNSSGGMAILRSFGVVLATCVLFPAAMLIFARVWRGPALGWGGVLLLAALTIIATSIVGAVKRRRQFDRSI